MQNYDELKEEKRETANQKRQLRDLEGSGARDAMEKGNEDVEAMMMDRSGQASQNSKRLRYE